MKNRICKIVALLSAFRTAAFQPNACHGSNAVASV